MKNPANEKINDSPNCFQLLNQAERVFGEAKYELSIQYYTRALQQLNFTVDIVYALYMRGCAYKAMGNVTKAKKDWQNAQNFNCEHPTGVDLIEIALNQA